MHRLGKLGKAIILAGLLFTTVATAADKGAGNYPSRPIRLILGQSAGGAPDILARIVAESVGKILGQPVIIEYKPSAGSIIAQDYIVQQPADGYTWLLGTPTMLTVLPYLGRKLPFDTFKDFAPIAMLGESANVLVVRPDSGFKTSADLIQAAKQSPGKIKYGSAGIGSTAHLAGALLATMTNTTMVHIPYQGAGQALTDLVGGRLDFIVTSPAAAKSYITSGYLDALATTGTQPDPILPELPTLETTVPGYQILQWWAIVLRAGTPTPIEDKVHAAVIQALNDPKVKRFFKNEGVTPTPISVPQVNQFIDSERQRYQDLIKRANISMDN